jgi:hypothetical protein
VWRYWLPYASADQSLARCDGSARSDLRGSLVVDRGYGTVMVNIVLVAVLFLAVAGAALGVDPFLPGVRTTAEADRLPSDG